MGSADLIKIARRRAGLTQAELARRLGRPRPNVSRWESGSVEPSFETLVEIARACDLDLTVNLFAQDTSNDDQIWRLLELSPAQRLAHQVAAANGAGGLVRKAWAGRGGKRLSRVAPFDPSTILRAIDRAGADYLLLGRLAANVHGSPNVPIELEAAVYLGPESADEEALRAAIASLGGRRHTPRSSEVRLDARPLQQAERWRIPRAGGTLAVVRMPPPGTGGFDDLLRDATPTELGRGLRVLVPSIVDLIRMADASPWVQDKGDLPTLRRAREFSSREPGDRGTVIPEGLEDLFAERGAAA